MENDNKIDSIETLSNWLTTHHISYEMWGKHLTKSLEMLLEEVMNGECALLSPPAVRSLSVVQVLIRQNGNVLIEKEQLLCDERIRQRESPPSEKMLISESWHQAAIRCVVEELQISKEQVEVLSKHCDPIVKIRFSESYPGLKSQYKLFPVEVKLPPLPLVDFWTDEKSGEEGDHVIGKHKWGWEPWESLESIIAKSFSDDAG